jgi:hypothetical protein
MELTKEQIKEINDKCPIISRRFVEPPMEYQQL